MAKFTYKITEVDTIYVQADNGYSLSVGVELYKEGESEVFEFRRVGFPLGTGKEVILKEMAKLCETLASDAEVGAKSEELDKQLTEAQSLKEDLIAKE